MAHRGVGWLDAGSMLLRNATALGIYRLTGGVGPFRVLALVSLATLAAGMLPARRRPRPADCLDRHYRSMSHSYAGLAAAAVAETTVRVPVFRWMAGGPTPAFWVAVGLAPATVMGAGVSLTRRRRGATLRPLRPDATVPVGAPTT